MILGDCQLPHGGGYENWLYANGHTYLPRNKKGQQLTPDKLNDAGWAAFEGPGGEPPRYGSRLVRPHGSSGKWFTVWVGRPASSRPRFAQLPHPRGEAFFDGICGGSGIDAISRKGDVVGDFAGCSPPVEDLYIWHRSKDGRYAKPRRIRLPCHSEAELVSAAYLHGRLMLAGGVSGSRCGLNGAFLWSVDKGKAGFTSVRNVRVHAGNYPVTFPFELEGTASRLLLVGDVPARRICRKCGSDSISTTPVHLLPRGKPILGRKKLWRRIRTADSAYESANGLPAYSVGLQKEHAFIVGRLRRAKPSQWWVVDSNGVRPLRALIPRRPRWRHLSPSAASNNGQIGGAGIFHGRPRLFLIKPLAQH